MSSEPSPPPVPQSAPAAPPQLPPVPAAGSAVISSDDKTMGVLMHVLGLVGFPIIGPLVIWLIKKDQSPYLDAQGREVLNFGVSMFIYSLVCMMLVFVIIGFLLIPIFGIAALVLSILGLIKASNGEVYRYPYIIRFF
jgi:uncharacterized protein